MINILKASVILITMSHSMVSAQTKGEAKGRQKTGLERFYVDIRSKNPEELFKGLTAENKVKVCEEPNLMKIPARQRGPVRGFCAALELASQVQDAKDSSAASAEGAKSTNISARAHTSEKVAEAQTAVEEVKSTSTSSRIHSSIASETKSFGRSRDGDVATAGGAGDSAPARETFGRSRDDRAPTAGAASRAATESFGRSRDGAAATAGGAADSAPARETFGRSRDDRAPAAGAASRAATESFGRSRDGAVATAGGAADSASARETFGRSRDDRSTGDSIAASSSSTTDLSHFTDAKASERSVEESIALEKSALDIAKRRSELLASLKDPKYLPVLNDLIAMDRSLGAQMVVADALLSNAAQHDANANRLYLSLFGPEGVVTESKISGHPIDAKVIADLEDQVSAASLTALDSRRKASHAVAKAGALMEAFEKAVVDFDAQRSREGGAAARSEEPFAEAAAAADVFVPEGSAAMPISFYEAASLFSQEIQAVNKILPYKDVQLATQFYDTMRRTGSDAEKARESLVRSVDELHKKMLNPRRVTMSLLDVFDKNATVAATVARSIPGFSEYVKIYTAIAADETVLSKIGIIVILAGVHETLVLAKEKLSAAGARDNAEAIRKIQDILVKLQAMEEIVQKSIPARR